MLELLEYLLLLIPKLSAVLMLLKRIQNSDFIVHCHATKLVLHDTCIDLPKSS